jgi:ABC-2 type transport system permease protein
MAVGATTPRGDGVARRDASFAARGGRMHFPSEVRTAAMVWRRDLLRFVRNKTRIVGGLMQPLLFLFVLGYGLGALVPKVGGVDYKVFIFPGVFAMSIVTTSMFSAMSIVWDREFGFLREMLVAPVSRTSILLGKTAGGATVATFQGLIMLALAPIVGVKLSVILVLELVGMGFLAAFALTSFGVFVSSRMKKMEGFQAVMQFLLFPMLTLSGAQFPLHNLPPWLTFLTRIDPVTYAVDPIRRTILAHQGASPQALATFGGNGVTWFNRPLTIPLELGLVVAFAFLFLAMAVAAFSKAE